MRRIITTLLALATLFVGLPAGAASWSSAKNAALPADAASTYGGMYDLLSCPSAGNCVAGGSYVNENSEVLVTVDTETSEKWSSTAVVVPAPSAASSSNPGMIAYGLSCTSTTSCVLVGQFVTTAGLGLPFIATLTNSSWTSQAITLPSNANATTQNSIAHSVTCTSAGNCVASGNYFDNVGAGRSQGWVASEVKGVWSAASELSMPSDASSSPLVTVNQTGCISDGNCIVVGSYTNSWGVAQAFGASETNGTWGPAQSIALPANASAYSGAVLSEATCVTGAECTAVGTYISRTGATEFMATSYSASGWARAQAITLPANAAASPHVMLYGFGGVSCVSSGNCVSGGQYLDSSGDAQGFLVNEVNGTWATATELVLPAGATQAGHNGGVVALACVAAGECIAGASYYDASGNYQAGIVSEANGVWGTAQQITLPAAGSSVGIDGGIYALACHSNGTCEGVGTYEDANQNYPAFTVSNY
jgi:hypothetical protein